MQLCKLAKISDPLEWQIDRRSEIQFLMFRLLSFLEGARELPDEDDDQWHPVGRMVAVSFSLWRSVFLTDVDTKRSRKAIYDDSTSFLGKVVKENAINFSDDRNMRAWSVVYYNSNARYRLERMWDRQEAFRTLISLKRVHALRDETVEAKNPRDLWDIYFSALHDSFELFIARWDKKYRNRRQGRRPSRSRPLRHGGGRKKVSKGRKTFEAE